MEVTKTDEWQLYEVNKDYNTRLDYYAKTDLHWRFYNNKPWEGIKTNGLPKMSFPIARSSINYFIASIMSQKVKMQYSVENTPDEPETEAVMQMDEMGQPMMDEKGQPIQVEQLTAEGQKQQEIKDFTDLMSGYAETKWETEKMDSKLRQLLLDGANCGDFCTYTYWNKDKETGQLEKGDFCTEIVDGVNVLFGNPNNPDTEAQPFILIVGREIVSKLKKEAEENGIPKDQIANIKSDNEYLEQAGQHGKIELDNKEDNGKTLYIIKLWKKDGQVCWKKSTKFCVIRKEVAMGISRYPLAWGNWEKVKNSYHGMSVMEGLIDNQININQMFAMIVYWMRYNAFGKVVIDSTRIKGWSNKLNEAIKVDGPVGSDVIYQLQAGNFNEAIISAIDIAIKYTKDFIGASDAALGQVKPENTSAIIAVAKQAAIPLENVQANLYQFVEDQALIWGEFMLKKYVDRTITYNQDGKKVLGKFNPKDYKDILLNVKIDVGPSSYWSEITATQILDNLLQTEKISFLSYLKQMPNGVISGKEDMIKEEEEKEQAIKDMEAKQMEVQTMNADAGKQFDKFMASLSPELQQAISAESQQMIAQTQPQI